MLSLRPGDTGFVAVVFYSSGRRTAQRARHVARGLPAWQCPVESVFAALNARALCDGPCAARGGGSPRRRDEARAAPAQVTEDREPGIFRYQFERSIAPVNLLLSCEDAPQKVFRNV